MKNSSFSHSLICPFLPSFHLLNFTPTLLPSESETSPLPEFFKLEPDAKDPNDSTHPTDSMHPTSCMGFLPQDVDDLLTPIPGLVSLPASQRSVAQSTEVTVLLVVCVCVCVCVCVYACTVCVLMFVLCVHFVCVSV